MLESFSDDEGEQAVKSTSGTTVSDKLSHTNGLDASMNRSQEDDQSDDPKSGTSEVRKLLRRKDELERSHKMQEKRHQRYQVSGSLSNSLSILLLVSTFGQ